jgi:hypothetical protein
MKRPPFLGLFVGALALLPLANTNAWEVATNVPATAIDSLPYTISSPGNYYLTKDLTTSLSAGAAITITASGVTLDLNGRTLHGGLAGSASFGILVANQTNVIVQQGTIDNFGVGVYWAPGAYDVNAKNLVENVHFNNNGIGVWSLSGLSNWVKQCVIDGGDIGVLFNQDRGSRVSHSILEDQRKTEFYQQGIALLTIGSLGVLFDENEVAKSASTNSNAFGQIMTGTDKYRFESFVGFPANHPVLGGTDEGANSL